MELRFGAGLIATRAGVLCAVQARAALTRISRCTSGSGGGSVGPHDGCSRGVVMTNQRFTTAAQQLAREHGVQLWDRAVLVDRIRQTPRAPS